MSHEGGDNHFASARERDLGPLIEEGRSEFALCAEKAEMLDGFLGDAWLAGTRSGRAKLLNQAIRRRKEQSGGRWRPSIEPAPPADVEAEFKAMMKSSAAALNFPMARTLVLWDLLTRAWTAGVRTYEAEIMATLIERKADLADEAQRWLEEEG